MKKFIIITLLVTLFAGSVFAQENNNFAPERNESKWTDMSYETAPIVKILEGKEGYVVMYQKKYAGVGTTVIPKSWAEYKKDTPRKLKFRNIKNPSDAYMTIVYKGGEFQKVILSIPMSKNNNFWGVVDYSKPLEGTDKEILEDLDI